MVCLVHFDFEMCFSPHLRAFCQHPTGGWGVHFDFQICSRHSGKQLLISSLTKCLRTRRFSKPTLRPSGATRHWKHTVLRDFSTSSRTLIFYLLAFSLLTLSLLTLLFADCCHRCCCICPQVGSLTSKRPSIILIPLSYRLRSSMPMDTWHHLSCVDIIHCKYIYACISMCYVSCTMLNCVYFLRLSMPNHAIAIQAHPSPAPLKDRPGVATCRRSTADFPSKGRPWWSRIKSIWFCYMHTRTHIHTHMYLYIYI